jgi:ABC transporter substrate binding protein
MISGPYGTSAVIDTARLRTIIAKASVTKLTIRVFRSSDILAKGERTVTSITPELIREVVGRNPELIVTVSSRLVLDFKAATVTIPIVGLTGDPAAAGIAPSVARLGGNITGISVEVGPEIYGRRFELLKRAVPGVSQGGVREFAGGVGRALRSRDPRAGP